MLHLSFFFPSLDTESSLSKSMKFFEDVWEIYGSIYKHTYYQSIVKILFNIHSKYKYCL